MNTTATNTNATATAPNTTTPNVAAARATGAIAGINPLTDINGLRGSGIFPQGREPSIRTLREWTKLRHIPFHRLGHFVYYDIAEVAAHIRLKLLVPARA